MGIGNSLSDLGKKLVAARVGDALTALDRGDVEAAYKAACRSMQLKLVGEQRQQLGEIFYRHGKLLTSRGRFGEATNDFSKAVSFSQHNETFSLRHRAAMQALKRSFCADQNRQSDIVSFCADMKGRKNVPIANPPRAAILHYVREAEHLHRPQVKLVDENRLDEFHALGTYRWRGDEKSADLFSQWIRRLKNGDKIASKHLGRLLCDWIWSETDCVKNADFLVAVPGDPQREAERGFNPPQMLAKAIQECLGIPMLAGVLERQPSFRSRESTYKELRKAHRLDKTARHVEGRSIVLVDDVATRGRTLTVCTEHLRDAGATRVVCVVLAQSVTTRREQRGLSGHLRLH